MIAFIIFCSLDIKFNFTTGSFLSSNGAPELRIFYEIAHRELTFVKMASTTGFIAKFRILCSLHSKDNEIGDMWIIEDTVKDYKSTLSKELIRGELNLQVPPGDYKFKIVINDLNSQREGVKELKSLRIKEFKRGQNISSLISYEEGENILVFFEVYNFDSVPFMVQYEVGKINDSIKFDTQSIINQVRLELPKDSLGFGTYPIKVSVGEVEAQDTVCISAPFWSGDYEKRVSQLHYIAEPWEMDSLLKVPKDKRKECWEAFWTRKDSIFRIGVDELEKEYLTRVDYADEHFSATQEGWRTDRGRVYIKLGNPDEKSSYPFEVDREPYEIWYYYSWNLKFVFVDKQGFGNYTLEYPKFWDEKIRFR